MSLKVQNVVGKKKKGARYKYWRNLNMGRQFGLAVKPRAPCTEAVYLKLGAWFHPSLFLQHFRV